MAEGTLVITISNQVNTPHSITDRDGNDYTSVIIGTQEWLVENLKTTHYADGSVIPNQTLCGNDYGALYNWYAATYSTGGASIAPPGWHVPTYLEQITLRSTLDPINNDPYTNVAGGLMKVTGTIYWDDPNDGASNISGFSAKGSGMRYGLDGTFSSQKGVLTLWNTRNYSANFGGAASVVSYQQYFNAWPSTVEAKKDGISIRLIKDDSTDPGTVSDIDGNIYPTVKIGTQVWMAADLKVTHYNDGTDIPEITDNTDWGNDTAGARCYYNNNELQGWPSDIAGAHCWYDNDSTYKDPYGALYNWYAVNNASVLAYIERNGIHETDWRVPTRADIIVLSTYLGGNTISGGKLKETGLTHWNNPNVASDTNGFKALGSGFREFDSCVFAALKNEFDIWTSEGIDADNAYEYYAINTDDDLYPYPYDKNAGFSVRLMRDVTSEPPEPPMPPVYDNIVPYSYGNFPEYRFYVHEAPSSLTYEVFPLKFLSTTISWEKSKENVFYRQKFNGSLLFGSNSIVYDVLGAQHNRNEDWLLFWGFEQSDPYARIDFTITKTLGGSTIIYFEGYFSVTNGSFDIDNCTFEVTPLVEDDYTDFLSSADDQFNILSVAAMGTVHAIHGVGLTAIDNDYTRTRWLAKIGSANVLEYLAQQTIGGAVTVVSDFFNVDPNYVTLDDNLLLHLTIAQKSDIIRFGSTDPATYAAMSWNEFMDILWNMFQVTWVYDLLTNTITVEHISWFTRGAGIDLRTQMACIATNKYSYLKEKMPKFEKFSYMEADGDNFVGAFIWYDSPAVNQDPDSNRIETSIPVTTDLEYIIRNGDGIADEGFVILCNYLDGADYKVRVDAGKFITTEFALNMNMSVANLQDAYHRHNRVLLIGYLNGYLTVFWTAQKIKQQSCTAIMCDELDPMDEITTELGETYFGGAKAIIKDVSIAPSGETKFNLLYGPADNPNTGVPNVFTVEVTLTVRSPYDPAFDEIDLKYIFNKPCIGNITTRFRVATFNDTGVFQGYSGWTTVIFLDTTMGISVLNHQINVLSTGWSISIELEYTTGQVDVFTGVPDDTWSYYVPFIYTLI